MLSVLIRGRVPRVSAGSSAVLTGGGGETSGDPPGAVVSGAVVSGAVVSGVAVGEDGEFTFAVF